MNEANNTANAESAATPAEKDCAAGTNPAGEGNAAGAFSRKISEGVAIVDNIFAKAFLSAEKLPWEKWLNVANGFIGRYLPLVIAASGVLLFFSSLVMAIREKAPISSIFILMGILVVTLFSMHLAPKALALPRSFIEKRELDAIRPEFLYILKVVFGLGGIFAALALFLQFDEELLAPAGIILPCSILILIAFSRPAMIGLKVAYPENVVDEVITILLLPIKLVLSLLTLIIGIATVSAFVFGIVRMRGDHYGPFSSYFFLDAVLPWLIMAILAPVIIPFAIYLLYLVAVFTFDFYRAIVCLPRKLDKLHESVKSIGSYRP